jgi:hypothetical protein
MNVTSTYGEARRSTDCERALGDRSSWRLDLSDRQAN